MRLPHDSRSILRILAREKFRNQSTYSISHLLSYCKFFLRARARVPSTPLSSSISNPLGTALICLKIKEPALRRRFLRFCCLIARDSFRPESISSRVSIRASYHDFMPLENGFYNPQALSSHLLLSPRQVILPFSTVNKSVESSSLGS